MNIKTINYPFLFYVLFNLLYLKHSFPIETLYLWKDTKKVGIYPTFINSI